MVCRFVPLLSPCVLEGVLGRPGPGLQADDRNVVDFDNYCHKSQVKLAGWPLWILRSSTGNSSTVSTRGQLGIHGAIF